MGALKSFAPAGRRRAGRGWAEPPMGDDSRRARRRREEHCRISWAGEQKNPNLVHGGRELGVEKERHETVWNTPERSSIRRRKRIMLRAVWLSFFMLNLSKK